MPSNDTTDILHILLVAMYNITAAIVHNLLNTAVGRV